MRRKTPAMLAGTILGVTDLAALMKNPLNTRTHDADEVAKAIENVSQRCQAFGFPPHIVVDEDNLVLTGYATVKAAEQLGLKQFVVSSAAPPLTDALKRALLIEDGHPLVAEMIGKPVGAIN